MKEGKGLTVILSPANDRKMLRNVKKLYRSSFPRFERKPFSVILKNRERGAAEILAAADENGSFLGLAIFAFHNDLVLLDYFAVCKKLRNGGIGSLILRRIEEMFSGKRMLLEIELPDPENDRKGIKKRRKEFYLRGGMTETGLLVKVFGVDMEILSYKCAVSFKEYEELYRNIVGERYVNNILKIREVSCRKNIQ